MKQRWQNRDEEEIKKHIKDIKRHKSTYGSSIKDFQVIKEIGRGSYGTVYKVLSVINKKIYALK